MKTSPGPRALAIIADDEDLGRVLLAESVADVGLESMAFGNGTDALTAALSREVTIVLLDVDMPGLDGFEVCRRLRAEARFANVPIVMVTGHEDSLAISRAFEAGATDFVAKPVNWALLPRRLEYILRNAASARSLNERMMEVRTLVEAIPDTLWVVDAEGHIQWSPHTQIEPGSHALTMDTVDVVPPKYIPQALEAIQKTARDGLQRKLEYREDRASYEMRFTRREGGDVVVVRQDTTERTVAAERIERLAYFDVLTDLPNRQRCIEVSERLFAEARRAGECVAVICLDIASLKRVNDTFGHSTGDAVLRAFAARLAQTVERFGADAQRLLIARFGGDEFVVVLRHASARSFGMQIANACAEAFRSRLPGMRWSFTRPRASALPSIRMTGQTFRPF